MRNYQPKDKKKFLNNLLLDVLSLILIVLVFIPQFQLISIYYYLFLAIEIMWIVTALLTHPRFFFGGDKYFKQSFMLCLITILIPLLFSVQTIANRYSAFLAIPLFYWIFSYNSIYRSTTTNIRIALVALVPIMYTSVQTILELIISPYAARMIKSSGDQSMELWLKGVSGYSLIYGSVIIFLVLIPILINLKKIKIKLIYSIFLIFIALISIILILLSNYLTALVVVISGLLLYLLLYSRNKYYLIFIVPFALIYFLERNEINLMAIETIIVLTPENGRVNNALKEVRSSMVLNVQVENVDSRSETRRLSLELIAKYPIGGYVTGLDGNIFNIKEVGQHSYILDTYALFGVFIGTFATWVMWQPFRYRIKRKYNYKLRVYSWIIGISFMTILFSNNLTPSIGFAAFFLFPTAFDYLKQKIHV